MPSSEVSNKAQGRNNDRVWTGLSKRVVYRTNLTGADAASDLADDAKIPPIDMKKSRMAYNNVICAFVRLLGGASSVKIEHWVNAVDVVVGVTPAGDETDWVLIEDKTITANGFVRFDGVENQGVPAGTHKLKIAAITPGAGMVEILEQHTMG